jgi:hypothetical protein
VEPKKLRLTILARLLASEAWLENAKSSPGERPGETQYDTIRREYEELQAALAS